MNAVFNHGNEPENEREAIKTCSGDPPPAQTQKNPVDSSEDADGKDALLAFSYLFVPLLFLGMGGKREREQVIDALIPKANS